jgi:shikimate kinase
MGLIFLTGMTGSGKTTVGAKLADRLGVMFVDLDHEIERAAERDIAGIFAESGEEEFRDFEAVALSVAASFSDAVIALGAGALDADGNFDLVRETGTLIYLRADVDLLLQRSAHLRNRPLLAEAKSQAELRSKLMDMLTRREPRFVFADVVVDVKARDSVEQLVESILGELAVR